MTDSDPVGLRAISPSGPRPQPWRGLLTDGLALVLRLLAYRLVFAVGACVLCLVALAVLVMVADALAWLAYEADWVYTLLAALLSR